VSVGVFGGVGVLVATQYLQKQMWDARSDLLIV
jgi:hypothetical protein